MILLVGTVVVGAIIKLCLQYIVAEAANVTGL